MLAFVCSLMMCSVAFASCGNKETGDETSNVQTTAAEESSVAEAESKESEAELTPEEEIVTADEDKAINVKEFEYDGEIFSQTYTQKLEQSHFSLSATIDSYILEDDTPSDMVNAKSLIECVGMDFHQKDVFGDLTSEIYFVDKNLYYLDWDNKSYSITDYSADMDVNEDAVDIASMAMSVTDGMVFTDRKVNDDGLVLEEYTFISPYIAESDLAQISISDLPKFTYYFTESGDIVKIDVAYNSSHQVFNIDSVDFEFTEITLPDFSDWTLESTVDEGDIEPEMIPDDTSETEPQE